MPGFRPNQDIPVGAAGPPATFLMMANDDADVLAARSGDQGAFARLYDRHAPVVLALCRRGGDETHADDAMQETFIRAFQRLHSLAQPGAFRPWLYGIARRVCAEQRRAAQRRERYEGAAAARRLDADARDAVSSRSARSEDSSRLTAALDALADDERLVIHLHYLEPDAPTAAQTTLGLSRAGYYKLLERARQRLAALMTQVPTP